jgi:hypothetical protein
VTTYFLFVSAWASLVNYLMSLYLGHIAVLAINHPLESLSRKCRSFILDFVHYLINLIKQVFLTGASQVRLQQIGFYYCG